MKSIFAYLFALALLTGAGRVQTRDGKTIDGAVSFDENAVLVRGAAEARVPWDQVARVSTAVPPAARVEVARSPATVPDGWKSQDVGEVRFPGSAACDEKGAFTLGASGWGAWGARDSFHFAYRSLKGDGQVIARVGKLDVAAGPVVAGVMIRQSVAPDAPMAAACLYPNGEVRLARRPAGGAREYKSADEPNPTAWVRLTRAGETVRAFRSADGKNWTQVDTAKVPMADDSLVGVCAWTAGNAWKSSAVVDSVTIVPGAPTLTYFPGADPLTQGVVTRDGNAFPAAVVSFDPAKGLKYTRGGGAEETMAADQVARLVFNSVPPDQAGPSGSTGVLLANGDFFEGDVTAVGLMPVDWPRPAQLKVTVRSVVFGNRTFEIGREVVAVDLGPVAASPAAYEVRTADHALIRAKTVAVKRDAVIVDNTPLPNVVDVKKL